MHIVPINIEPYGIIVSSPGQLSKIKSDKPELYASLLASGDAGRLCGAFAEECDEECGAEPELLTGSHQMRFLEPVVVGLHRQKAVINVGERHICDDARFSYVTLCGGELRITGTAIFSGVVFDGVRLIIEAGASASLYDCEFGSRNDCAIEVLQGGRITRFDEVVFVDCRKHILFHYADRSSAGTVIDFDMASSIVDAFEDNIIRTIALDRDFLPPNNEIELRQPTRFLNATENELRFEVKRLQTETDFSLDGDFLCSAEVISESTHGQTLILSRFSGTLSLTGCSDTRLRRTLFEHARVSAVDSGIRLEECSVEKDSSFTLTDSAVSINASALYGLRQAFSFAAVEEADPYKLSEPLQCAFIAEGSNFERCGPLFDTSIPLQISIGKSRFNRCDAPITAANSFVAAHSVESVGCDNLIALEKSTLEASNMEHNGDGAPYILTGLSSAKITHSVFSGCKTGVFMHESKVELIEDRFTSCDVAVEAKEGKGIIAHGDCLFEGSIMRNFVIGHGNLLENLKDKELAHALDPVAV